MPFQNIFRMFKPGTPVRNVANIDEMNFIRNVFNDIQGINCRIDKPTHASGMGWRIVVGDGSDVERPPNISDPFAGNISDFSFKVTHNSGNEYTISEGNFYGFNQIQNVTGDNAFAAGAGDKFIRLKIDLTGSDYSINTVSFESKNDEADSNTTLTYWYTIAEVNNGVTKQRVVGDIYDRNLPTMQEDYDVVTYTTTDGYPFAGDVIAKGP